MTMPLLLKRLVFGGVGGGNAAAEAGLFILRVATGVFMAVGHGLQKIPPPQGFITSVDALNLPGGGTFNAWVAGIGELVAGLLLAFGLATRLAALWLIGIMSVAAFLVHGSAFSSVSGFFLPAPGAAEPAVMYLLIAVTFLLAGSGRTGLDRFVRGR